MKIWGPQVVSRPSGGQKEIDPRKSLIKPVPGRHMRSNSAKSSLTSLPLVLGSILSRGGLASEPREFFG